VKRRGGGITGIADNHINPSALRERAFDHRANRRRCMQTTSRRVCTKGKGRFSTNAHWAKSEERHPRIDVQVTNLKQLGGEGRNRPDFPAVAPLICLISLGIQAKTVLSERIFFNPFGVRFGVRSVNLS
jgi:hypothetical protein